MAIQFKDNSWTATIGKDFTFDTLAEAAKAYAQTLGEGKSLLVGYDTRFQAAAFAEHAAQILAAEGLKVAVSKTALPTPALAFAVRHLGASGGFMITAGSQPASMLGVSLLEGEGSEQVETGFDIRKDYYAHLGQQLDMEALKSYKGVVYLESMGGASCGWLAGFVKWGKLPLELRELHAVPDPMFYGVVPDIAAASLSTAITLLKPEQEPVCCLVSNGDGSRVGMVAAGGEVKEVAQGSDAFLTTLQLLESVAKGQ